MEKLRKKGDTRDLIELSRYQVEKCFKKQNSNTCHRTPFPYIRNKLNTERLKWEREIKKWWVRKTYSFLKTKTGSIPIDIKEF